MKKNTLKLLTGITAVTMAVTQPLSVLADENGSAQTTENANSDGGGCSYSKF